MHAKLKEILKEKKKEVARLKKANLPEPDAIFSGNTRDFSAAIASNGSIRLIAEIKFRSPSSGMLREGSDPLSIGKAYEKSGAAAISLLTDRPFFKGDLQSLPILKEAVSLPILRKDFIIDEIQIAESAKFGADVLLLIARILSAGQLKHLLDAAGEYGMDVVTEIHDEEDLEKAMKCNARIIGINNRDLDTFEISLNTTFQLAPLIPADRLVIGESGIHSAQDIHSFKGLNIRAVLVGSALMSADDPGQKAAELAKAGV